MNSRSYVCLMTGALLLAGCGDGPQPRSDLSQAPPEMEQTPPLVKPAPDAWKLAFNSTRDGNYEVYVASLDGSTPLNISNSEGTDWVYFADRRIIFGSDRGGEEMPGWHLYIMNRDGGDLRPLSRFPVNDSYLGSSPDGARFVVASSKDGNPELYIIDTTGAQLARLTETDAEESDPDWSPDGQSIAFRSNRGGAWDIWVMGVDGKDPVQITDYAANDTVKGYQGEGPPRWSPDGTRIAFGSHRDGDWDVYTMNLDGSDLQNLTRNEVFEDGYPCWSPDGRELAFFSDRDGNFEIYVMRADGSEPRRVTDDPADDLAPVWVRR